MTSILTYVQVTRKFVTMSQAHTTFFEVPDSDNQLFTKHAELDVSKANQAQPNTELNSQLQPHAPPPRLLSAA